MWAAVLCLGAYPWETGLEEAKGTVHFKLSQWTNVLANVLQH